MDHLIWRYTKISVKSKRVCSPFCKHGQWMNTHQSPFHFSIPHPKLATNVPWRLKNYELPETRLSCGEGGW